MILVDKETGKEYEWRSGKAVAYGDSLVLYNFLGDDVARLISVPKRHTFGRVTFEETGEVRAARKGEWRLSKWTEGEPEEETAAILQTEDTWGSNYVILRPVRITPDV